MALVTTAEAKAYLRVDSTDEDTLISSLISSAEFMCADVARLSDDDWSEIDADAKEGDDRELLRKRALLKVAIFFAIGYLFEHREDADHTDLDLTLRSLLYSIREGVF